MLSDERIAEIAESHIDRLKDVGHKSGLVIRSDAELACEGGIRAALTELAESFKGELAVYDGLVREMTKTVANLEQRIRELEAQRVPEGWRLVPIYPTSDMLSAFDHCDAQGCQFAETYWDAMLAVAPAPKEDSRHECSSFCVPGEQCAITADGDCDVRAEIAALQDKCSRLHVALVAITNVPAGTVLTDYQMRLIARNAIAT